MKKTEEIMEILAAYDLTHSFRDAAAHYREFVQLERLKKNSQFGANRTVVFGDAERGGGRDAV